MSDCSLRMSESELFLLDCFLLFLCFLLCFAFLFLPLSISPSACFCGVACLESASPLLSQILSTAFVSFWTAAHMLQCSQNSSAIRLFMRRVLLRLLSMSRAAQCVC